MNSRIKGAIKVLQAIDKQQEIEDTETPHEFWILLHVEEHMRTGGSASRAFSDIEQIESYRATTPNQARAFDVVQMRCRGMTYREIGEQFGVGVSRARDLAKRGGRILAHPRWRDSASLVVPGMDLDTILRRCSLETLTEPTDSPKEG